jgi:hypothetical protein
MGDLLVLMQLDDDTQITQLSPWFANMRQFVQHVCRHSALPVRVRAHPLMPPAPELRELVQELGGTWDSSASLGKALVGCRAVACINSSCGIEALAHRMPVLCYGLANYRHPGAVYCLTNSGEETRRTTEQLAAGRCDLFVERCEELLQRILGHQWRLDEIPLRLPHMIQSLLPGEGENGPHRAGWGRMLSRLIRDLSSPFATRRQAA